ncbi:MAG: hypothetical protein FWG53_03190, partial [Clostridiales bacterium]|nr:hypothetical protein [Clostridiales bacterium]
MGTSKGAKLVETAKSIILVVLFLFTILLLYFFWGSTPIKDLIRENPPQYGAVDPAAVMRPDFTSICFGGNSYTVAADKFDMVMDCFREFSASRNLSIEEIAKERYDEVERSPSIKAVFGYFAPFGAFCEIHGIDRIPGVDSVETLSELVYAADYDDR